MIGSRSGDKVLMVVRLGTMHLSSYAMGHLERPVTLDSRLVLSGKEEAFAK